MNESRVNRASLKIDMIKLKVCIIIDDDWRDYISDNVLGKNKEERDSFLQAKEDMQACNFMICDTAYIALDTKCSREVFLHECFHFIFGIGKLCSIEFNEYELTAYFLGNLVEKLLSTFDKLKNVR
jgi:hypothetical protein